MAMVQIVFVQRDGREVDNFSTASLLRCNLPACTQNQLRHKTLVDRRELDQLRKDQATLRELRAQENGKSQRRRSSGRH